MALRLSEGLGHTLQALNIFASPGLASCRRRPLSSNVRHQTKSLVPLQQEVRLSAWIEQPRCGQAANPVRHRAQARGNDNNGQNGPIEQPDFSRGRRGRPVQTHDEAAGGGNRTLQCTSGERFALARQRGSTSAVRHRGHSQGRRRNIQWLAIAARRKASCKNHHTRRRRGV